MADESPVQNLCDETKCPICLEYFKDPVIIGCGHNFCQACITQRWKEPNKDALCPQCREPCQQRSFRPNRQLATIAEIAKQFSLQMAKGAEVLGRVCEIHLEPLKLFCENDQALICVVCDKSQEHREHKVIPKEEAFEAYKGKIQSHLKFLIKEEQKCLSSILSQQTESKNLLEQTEKERQKITAEFMQLHQFLEQQEKLLLVKLKNLDDEIENTRKKQLAKLSDDISAIKHLIKEMKEKQKQSANEFLQDIKVTLQRCDEKKCVGQIVSPLEFSVLRKQIEKIAKKLPFFQDVMKGIKAKLAGAEIMALPTVGLSMDSQETTQSMLQQLWNTYGYARASRDINLLSCWTYIIGTERITSGRHSWVVNVENERFWAVGVVKQSLRHYRGSQNRIFALGRFPNGEQNIFISPQVSLGSNPSSTSQIVFPLDVMPKKVRVSLNCEEGSLAFFDADNSIIIYTFWNNLFPRGTICSWLSLGK
ncbi:zinc finger protein RFP-like [Elgaria multicarinata webbii]|uniref:zinc finger protein RFP-like n=1 Tax=Elgaria multicarinata webbii TaxID=159646 RepID=UPI002FCCFB3B